MVTITLTEDQVRDLVKALLAYRQDWEWKRSSRQRALSLMDSVLCANKESIESMRVDLLVADVKIQSIAELARQLAALLG